MTVKESTWRSGGFPSLAVVTLTLFVVYTQTALATSNCPLAGSFPTLTPPGGFCATYSSSLPDGSLAFCNGIVDYPYFLPSTQNQTFLDATAQGNLLNNDPNNALLLSMLPERCTTQLKRIVCLAVYQACELVDPFYLDKSCDFAGGEACTSCGDVTTPASPNFFSGTHLQPTYGSACAKAPSTFYTSRCVTGPGKVPGMGNIGWEGALQVSGLPINMPQFCAAQGLTWSENAKSCLAAIPRSPCKGECNKAWNMDRTVAAVNGFPVLVNAVCPLVSGNFSPLLTFLQTNDDPYVQLQATYALNNITSGRTTVSLLGAFSMGPKCNDVVPGTDLHLFGDTYTQELRPGRANNGSLGQLIAGKALGWKSKFGEICHCVNNTVTVGQTGLSEATNVHCDATKPSTYCTTLMTQTAMCHSGGQSTPPNSGIRFVGHSDDDAGMHPICKSVVKHPNNQPNAQTLAFLQAAYGLTLDQAMGAFFVPPTPGLPALATGDMSARPLCAIPNGLGNGEVFRGNNSYQCAVASVNAAANVIPPVLSGTCRLKFLDMLCNQAHMKLDFKSMCLLQNDAPCDPVLTTAAQTNKIAFSFALPRFASQAMCTAFKEECAGFLSKLTPLQRARIDATFNCTGTVSQTCTANNPLDSWTSSTWGCASLLNGKPAYPATVQQIASLTQLTAYATANGLTGLANLVVTTPVVPSVSAATGGLDGAATCECPAPLVVPQDPAHTLQPGICCQQQCTGYMFSDADFNQIILTQKVVSVMSLFGTTFIVLTWGLFKIKRSQPLTFFIGLASLNVSFVFIIPTYYKPDIREVFCKDNTQPNLQSDGGMCLFQSIWLAYWTLCTCCFWWTQSFDLYLRIVRGERHLDHMTKFYHLFAWGIPLIVVIVHLACNAYGYRQMQFWCFLRDMPENPDLIRGLDLGLFYGTIIAVFATGLIFMFLVMYQMFKITSRTAATAQSSNKLAKKMALYRTPVFFVFFFSYVWVSIFGWRFDLEVQLPLLTEAGGAWVECLLTNFAAGIPDPATNPAANTTNLAVYGVPPNTGCGLLLPVRLPFSSIIYLMFIAGLQGVFIFIIFGAKMENLNLWKEKLHLTTKKYDTTAEDSSTKENKSGAKPSILSQAMSTLFSPSSPGKAGDSRDEKEGGSAVMVNGLQSGKFIAVTEAANPVKHNQVAAAYMSEET